MQVADILVQSAKDKHPYIEPRFDVIPVEQTHLICTSTIPKADETKEDDFEDKGETDGGTTEIGIGF